VGVLGEGAILMQVFREGTSEARMIESSSGSTVAIRWLFRFVVMRV
jgi:hypothetical protein